MAVLPRCLNSSPVRSVVPFTRTGDGFGICGLVTSVVLWLISRPAGCAVNAAQTSCPFLRVFGR